ncbi:DNA recombination protein RmuC [Patescibacteria group bacterium]
MSLSYVLILVAGVFVGGVLTWFLVGRKKEDVGAFTMLQDQLKEIRGTLDTKLGESTKSMQDVVRSQFKESQDLIKDITKEVTEVKEVNKQVFTVTEQLQNLEKIFKNQKQRGSIGEAGLELTLSNILPPSSYKLQYGFKNGDIVDAAIVAREGIIPVDAKFSLDNYLRIMDEDDEERRSQLEKDFKNDLKKRIDETAKYIKPEEGTLPFAFMYIPAEAIYYDLLVNEVGAIKVNTRNLIDYAMYEKKVIIVSPTTFSAYLSSVLYGFKAFKIEESAKEIGKRVEGLRRHIHSYSSYFDKLGNSLKTTVSHYNNAGKELKKVDKDVLRITGEGADVEPMALDKPEED